MDVGRNFILIKFSGIPGLVESSRFFRHRVDISRNLRLIIFSRFFRFQFGVRMVDYKIFLLIIKGGK